MLATPARLRISRQSAHDSSRTPVEPQPGPSRTIDDAGLESQEDEVSEQEPISESHLNRTDTPAARLRAVLGKLNDSTNKPAIPTPQTPSELDSDFDPPANFTASFAQKSLMSVFSHARREPGDTPQKSRSVRRRNSVGESQTLTSPRAQRVQQERAANMGHRKSLSDEEVENCCVNLPVTC